MDFLQQENKMFSPLQTMTMMSLKTGEYMKTGTGCHKYFKQHLKKKYILYVDNVHLLLNENNNAYQKHQLGM